MTSAAKPTVAVLGGGVAGLSAAHELMDRGFEVRVFEARAILGGKARSIGNPDSGQRGKPLPAEHGFRIFPAFYYHLPDTLKRIPSADPRGGTVFDQLVPTKEFGLASYDRPLVKLKTTFPTAFFGLRKVLKGTLKGFIEDIELKVSDLSFFGEHVFQIMSSCLARRRDELEKIDWWDFVEASHRDRPYQHFVGVSLSCGLAAIRPRAANTKVQGDIIVQLLLSLLHPGTSAIRVLNGPTSEVWIDPWRAYLSRKGVELNTNLRVEQLQSQGNSTISAVTVVDLTDPTGQTRRDITADYYVLAVPVEVAAGLLTSAHNRHLLTLDPTLENIIRLHADVDWMNGVLFYLRRELPIVHGHILYIESPWSITSVSQAQFWPPHKLAEYGDGSVKDIMSVCVSNWHVPGTKVKKPAMECTTEEIFEEVWFELKKSLNQPGQPEILSDADRVGCFLDPDIVAISGNTQTPIRHENLEPLLVAKVNTGPLRPSSATLISNLFLASDYVQTNTQLPCMEAANEAARRAVNGIIAASGLEVPLCRIWALHEPWILGLWRSYDEYRYARGLPWQRCPTLFSLASWLLLQAYHLFVRTRGKLTGHREVNAVSRAAERRAASQV